MKRVWNQAVLWLILAAGLTLSVLTAVYAYRANGDLGFPLDDPWIHLQFAKNLHDYGAFSYFKDQVVTSGSTAPLYTLLLTGGYFFTDNEMILSYVLGVLFFLAGGSYFFRLAEVLFPENQLIVLAGMFLFMSEPRLHWIALSGMETTLFIALLLGVLFHYHKRQPVPLGALSGLLLWTRPEAVILLGVLAIDVMYVGFLKRRRENQPISFQWMTNGLTILGVMAAGYAVFNLVLSGSLLPNTYAAKLTYYSAGGSTFPSQVFHFLVDGHMILFSFSVGLGIVSVIRSLASREINPFFPCLLFSVAMVVAYWMKLPYLYQNGRYLMPILPFVLLLGLHGIVTGMQWLQRVVPQLSRKQVWQVAAAVLLAVIVVQFVRGTLESRVLYQNFCQYINARQVKAAKWIRDHLPDQAVVATHDVGAIAFYSKRRVVDMVGLISPEMIENIGNLNALKAFMTKQGTTHLALLRNWFEAVNVNPVFQTDERFPEILEIFEYDPSRIHFTSKEGNWLTENGWRAIASGNLQQGGPMLEEAVRREPRSSRAHYGLGTALLMVGNLERAEQEFKRAVELHPGYGDAHLAHARVMVRMNKPREAINLLEQLVKTNPAFAKAFQALGEIYSQFRIDSVKAERYFEQYRVLEQAGKAPAR